MDGLHLLTANLSVGSARTVKENGREYLVAPATIIVPGVLAGSRGPLYYPPDEVAAKPGIWNNVLVTAYHPFDPATGAPLSSKDPGVRERQGIGVLRNDRFQGGKRRAEIWFDVDATANYDRNLRPEARMLPRLRQGKPIELSTGLFTDDTPARNGSKCPMTGRLYTHTARNYRADHLAVLPDQQGACSVNDGCGVLVNSWSGATKEAGGFGKKGKMNTSFWHHMGELLGLVSNDFSPAAREAAAASKAAHAASASASEAPASGTTTGIHGAVHPVQSAPDAHREAADAHFAAADAHTKAGNAPAAAMHEAMGRAHNDHADAMDGPKPVTTSPPPPPSVPSSSPIPASAATPASVASSPSVGRGGKSRGGKGGGRRSGGMKRHSAEEGKMNTSFWHRFGEFMGLIANAGQGRHEETGQFVHAGGKIGGKQVHTAATRGKGDTDAVRQPPADDPDDDGDTDDPVRGQGDRGVGDTEHDAGTAVAAAEPTHNEFESDDQRQAFFGHLSGGAEDSPPSAFGSDSSKVGGGHSMKQVRRGLEKLSEHAEGKSKEAYESGSKSAHAAAAGAQSRAAAEHARASGPRNISTKYHGAKAAEHKKLAGGSKHNARKRTENMISNESVVSATMNADDLAGSFAAMDQEGGHISPGAATASKAATEMGTPGAHKAAAKMHNEAADHHEDRGNDEMAEHHRAVAGHHAEMAEGLKTNSVLTTNEWSDAARAASAASRAASAKTKEAIRKGGKGVTKLQGYEQKNTSTPGHLSTLQHAEKTLEGGRPRDVGTAHEKAASHHEGAALAASNVGQHEVAAAHSQAAAAHREAAHEAHSVGGRAKSFPSLNSREEVSTMSKSEKIARLTANCRCEETKQKLEAVYNGLNEESLNVLVANAKAEGSNADVGKTGTVQAGDEEDDEDAHDMPGTGLQVHATGKLAGVTKNALTLNAEDQAALDYARRRLQQDRQQLASRLVANVADPKRRQLLFNKYVKLHPDQLGELLSLQGPAPQTQNQRRPRVDDPPATLYLGAGGVIHASTSRTDNAADDEDLLLDIPILNMQEISDAYNKKGSTAVA